MKKLKITQYYFCPICYDFFPEKGIVFENLPSYLSSTSSGNRGTCQNGHERNIEKNNVIYLLDKPEKYSNSCILCFDCKDFSEKADPIQFNIQSILCVACEEIEKLYKSRNISIEFKGTGDGFIAVFKSCNTDIAIDFCKELINKYLKHLDYIEYRIGISFGTFFSYWGLGSIKDFFGSEVIKVCRIADFGNKNIILLSKEAKLNLFESKKYHMNISDIGNCIDKHRRPHLVYNYNDGIIGSDFFSQE